MRSTPNEVCGHVRVRVIRLITTREGRNTLESREEGMRGHAAPNHLRPTPPRQCHPQPPAATASLATLGTREPPRKGAGGRVVRRPSPRLPTAPRRDGLGTARRDANFNYIVHTHDRPGSGPGQPESRSGGAGPPTPRLVSLETTPSPSLQGSPPGWTRQRASAQTLDRPWGRCVARRSCRATVRFVTRNSRPLNSGGFSRRSSYRSLQGRSSSTG